MRTINLKDGIVEIPTEHEKHLDEVLEILNVKSFSDVNISEYNSAMFVCCLTSEDGIEVAGKKHRLRPQ